MRTVYLPAIQRRVSLGQYVKAVKLAMANPDETFKYGLDCWWPVKGKDIALQFRAAISRRMYSGIPYNEREE